MLHLVGFFCMNWSVTRLCSESRGPRRWYFYRIESPHEGGGTTLLRNIGYYVSTSDEKLSNLPFVALCKLGFIINQCVWK